MGEKYPEVRVEDHPTMHLNMIQAILALEVIALSTEFSVGARKNAACAAAVLVSGLPPGVAEILGKSLEGPCCIQAHSKRELSEDEISEISWVRELWKQVLGDSQV